MQQPKPSLMLEFKMLMRGKEVKGTQPISNLRQAYWFLRGTDSLPGFSFRIFTVRYL